MKRITTVLFATGLLAAFASGCKEEYKTYSDAEYVMFADTMSVNRVLQDQEYFRVPVASTTACDYDRTFGVEVIDQGSSAIEGRHYRLKSNTITIKAGERATDVLVHGYYDRLEPSDSLKFYLKLVLPDAVKWDESLYKDRTKVVLLKSCPYQIEEFSGWCVVTSMFLNTYPGVENKSIQRLIRTDVHLTQPNTIILHNWLFTGYDVNLTLHPDDVNDPLATMAEDQVIGDEVSVFGQINGDNKILVRSSSQTSSYFDTCDRSVTLSIEAYVENQGTSVGSLGQYLNILEWVSDEEADRLQREEGM